MNTAAGAPAQWPAPAPGAAPRAKMIMAQAGLETRMLVRNGEQLLLTLVIPVLLLTAFSLDRHLVSRPACAMIIFARGAAPGAGAGQPAATAAASGTWPVALVMTAAPGRSAPGTRLPACGFRS